MFINKFPDISSHLRPRQNVGFIFKFCALVPNNSKMCTLMEYACFAHVTGFDAWLLYIWYKSYFNVLGAVQISQLIFFYFENIVTCEETGLHHLPAYTIMDKFPDPSPTSVLDQTKFRFQNSRNLLKIRAKFLLATLQRSLIDSSADPTTDTSVQSKPVFLLVFNSASKLSKISGIKLWIWILFIFVIHVSYS